jgi:hypothetical protein
MDLVPCKPTEMELMDLDRNNEAGNHYLVLSATTKADKEKEEQVYLSLHFANFFRISKKSSNKKILWQK